MYLHFIFPGTQSAFIYYLERLKGNYCIVDMLIRTPDNIRKDPNFQWCGSSSSPAGLGPPDCVTEAETELKLRGLNVTGFATYQYEEDFSDKIMCGKLDRMINSSRIYYRLVLPMKNVRWCNYHLKVMYICRYIMDTK